MSNRSVPMSVVSSSDSGCHHQISEEKEGDKLKSIALSRREL